MNPKNYGGSIPWIKIGDLSDGPVLCAEESITEQGLENSSAKLLERETLLVAMYGSIGKLGITTMQCATNQAIAFCSPSLGMDLHYLLYSLMCDRKKLIDLGQGGTQLNISQGILKEHVIAVAPEREQKKIVSKIDEIFSRIDEGERALKHALVLAERYRQSILGSAVTGELTRKWREQCEKDVEAGSILLARIFKARRASWEKSELDRMKAKGIKPAGDAWKEKYEEPALPDVAELPELPPGWVWATAETVCESVHSGTTPEREFFNATSRDGIPFIKVYNLTMNGALDFTIDPTFVDAGHHQQKMKRSHTYPGDVLTNIVGPPLGKVSIVPPTFPCWNINQAVAAFRATSWIDHKFLAIYLQSDVAKSWLRSTAKTTTSQVNLAITSCRRLPVPIPPLDEQLFICDLVERSEGQVASVSLALDSGCKTSDALRQAVLKSAFAGALVPSDPDDEPASVLLERIAAERAASTEHKPVRGRKAGRQPR